MRFEKSHRGLNPVVQTWNYADIECSEEVNREQVKYQYKKRPSRRFVTTQPSAGLRRGSGACHLVTA